MARNDDTGHTATGQGAGQGAGQSNQGVTVHMRVPEKDQITRDFLAAQDNKSTSVRMLIRAFVAQYGAADVVETMAQLLGTNETYAPMQMSQTAQPAPQTTQLPQTDTDASGNSTAAD